MNFDFYRKYVQDSAEATLKENHSPVKIAECALDGFHWHPVEEPGKAGIDVELLLDHADQEALTMAAAIAVAVDQKLQHHYRQKVSDATTFRFPQQDEVRLNLTLQVDSPEK